jgi:fibronectin type 3 domain-containing protein
MYSAVGFTSSTNIVFQYNSIINPGQNGIVIGGGSLGSGVTGNAIINSNSVTGLNSGMKALTNNVLGYVAIIPTAAAGYSSMSGVTTETCAEGGQDLTGIASGDWSAYNSINLTGVNTFVARVASAGAGGNIEIHLDSPSGTVAGTCPVPGTGGWQTYVNAYCNLTGSSGTHNVYLVYTGGAGNLFNVQFFGVFAAPPAFSHQLVVGNTYSLKALANGKYVTAPNSGSNSLIASSSSVGTAESFKIIDAGGGNIGFQSLINSNYVTSENNGASPLIANRTGLGSWETFTEFDAGNGYIAIRAMNDGKYVTAPNSGTSPLIASSTSIGTNESFTVGFISGVIPAPPANLMATAGNTQAILTWLASPSATSYNVKRSTTSGGSYTTIVTNLTSLGYTDTNLANATTYYYVVSAQNPAGESTNSSQASVIPGSLSRTFWVATSSTSGSDSPGNALDGNLTTRWSTGGSQVNGQWFQVDMGTANVFNKLILNYVNSANDYPRGYQVTVSSNGINWSSSVATGVGSNSITTISFAAQSARYVRITQTGSASGTYWSIDEFNVMGTVSPAPTGLTATNTSSTQINLAWNAAAGASGYNLKRSTTSGGSYVTIATNLPYLNYSDSGLASGTAYYYVVTATNIYGESGNSAEATARPIVTTPVPFSFATGGGQIQMSWPTDHTGWHVQIQTNSLNAGIGTHWVTVPNSNVTNQFSVPINPTSGNVFFRLVFP